MATGRQIQKKGQSNATPTPATGMFKPRPFAMPAEPEAATAPELQTKTEPGQVGGSRLSRIDVSAPPPIQPKLAIGAPDDKYEQEADTIARKVVKQISTPTPPDANGGGDSVQRQMFSTSSIMRRTVQRREAIEGGTASSDLESTISQARSSGIPLGEPIRRQMEGAFGADFSGVRVHTNNTADTLNRSLSARAFTTGNNIFFKQGEYNPSSSSGKELLAHELTHTIQQGSVQRQATSIQPVSLTPIDPGVNSTIQGKYLENQQLFSKDTNLGTFYSRGALEAVDEALKAYEKTIIFPEVKDPTLASKPEHIDEKLKKLFKLKDVVEFWVFQHFDLKDASKAKTTRINPTLDLQEEITQAIKQQVKVYNQVKGLDASDQDVEDRLRSDSMDSALKSRVATLIDAILQPGALSKLSAEISLAIDVQPPGYVGFDLGLDVERKENDVLNIRSELAATGGVRVPKVFDIKAKLGGYVEAEAGDSRKTMNLISYGLYRKVVESKLMPASVAGVIWGGSFGESGQIMAAKLAADIERGVFGAEGGEEAFVDLGLLAGIGAEVGDKETLGGGVEYKYTTGQKYTKSSVESAGGLGKVTKEDVGNQGKKRKGEGTSAHEFTAKLSAGIFNGKVGYKKSGESQEITGSAQFSGIPDIVSFVLGVEGTINSFKSAYKNKEKSKKASDTIQGLDGLIGTLQTLAGDGAAISSIPTTSTKGEFAIKASKEGTSAWVIEIMFNQITGAPIPGDLGVVSVEVSKSDTRLKFSNKGGSWKTVHFG
ncbi:eCIS core domain-containing protein [Oscillatoria acuminata]|uniref:eCIS core domain-containing protein n=1 Tax=Oscillatoria acuminata PCC 6304 TaxID=56110 RepID=K9TEG2_9CYAN|nr:DUF4157 domain-containing protein [Oscillatoria acuminata]AFY80783.1 hypothetical protein Oscil6304_1054 [Oscillatoria acuminata PCC 6304]